LIFFKKNFLCFLKFFISIFSLAYSHYVIYIFTLNILFVSLLENLTNQSFFAQQIHVNKNFPPKIFNQRIAVASTRNLKFLFVSHRWRWKFIGTAVSVTSLQCCMSLWYASHGMRKKRERKTFPHLKDFFFMFDPLPIMFFQVTLSCSCDKFNSSHKKVMSADWFKNKKNYFDTLWKERKRGGGDSDVICKLRFFY
jgi:hypothetical protein